MAVVPIPHGEHDEERERNPPHDVGPERRIPEARRLADVPPQQLVAQADEECRRHQRKHKDVESDRVALEPPVAPERHREREAEQRDDDACDDAEVQRLSARRAHVVGDRVEEARVPQCPPPLDPDRTAEREGQLTRRPLKREDRHQDHRDVEEEEEEREIDREPALRPVRASFHLTPNDDVLRPRPRLGCRDQRLGHRSSRRFEKRVITQTAPISRITSSTADAAPCGYWTAPILELISVPTEVMLPPPTVATVP